MAAASLEAGLNKVLPFPGPRQKPVSRWIIRHPWRGGVYLSRAWRGGDAVWDIRRNAKLFTEAEKSGLRSLPGDGRWVETEP